MLDPYVALKHVGILKSSQGRIVVVFKQIPGDGHYALIAEYDKLLDVDRDELLHLLKSRQGQGVEDFGAAMHEYKGLLQHFHERGLLVRVPVTDILMKPTAKDAFELVDVINQINKSRGLPPLGPDTTQNLPTTNPMADRIKDQIDNVEEREQIAKNILFEATLMMRDVQRKMNEAFALAPHLRNSDLVAKTELNSVTLIQTELTNVGELTPKARTKPTKEQIAKDPKKRPRRRSAAR